MVSSSRVGDSGRQLRKALLISAALHLFVLFAVVATPEAEFGEPESARSLQVVRLSPPRGAVVPAARSDVRPGDRPARQSAVLSTSSVAPEPTSQIVATPAAFPALVEREQAPTILRDVAATPGPPAVSAIAAKDEPRSEPASSEGYADALRSYRVALALQARRHRLYPPAAQEMGLGGRSEIEVVLPAAAPPELRIKKTSGHPVLDQAALEMLRRSVGSVELPVLLKGRRFVFALPVEFVPSQ